MRGTLHLVGLLIDENLSWKDHIRTLTTKISKTVGLIAKLRHIVPNQTLLNIYKSLIVPYITYGLTSWGNASETLLNKGLVLQKRALRLIHFAQAREHAIPVFLKRKLLPLKSLYYEKNINLMYDINTNFAPIKISNLFSKITSVHSYNTRSSTYLSIFLPNNPHLTFKVRHFHVLVLTSGMGYQLDSKTYPEIVFRKLLEQN